MTKRKPRKVDRGGETIVLPPGTRAYLSARQIAAALDISERHFREMVATGRYPGADVSPRGDDGNPLGRVTRWRVETHNGWCETELAKGG